MDRLRLILLIVGVVLIAGIFVWELFRKRAAQRRRAQLLEHLDEEERRPLIGESVLLVYTATSSTASSTSASP